MQKRKSTRRRKISLSRTNYDEWVQNYYNQFINSNKKKDIKSTHSLRVDFIEMNYVDSGTDNTIDSYLRHGYILYKPMFSRQVYLYMYKGKRAKLQVERAITLKLIVPPLILSLALSPFLLFIL